MKISELVTKLEEIKQEHGDLPVWINDVVLESLEAPLLGPVIVIEGKTDKPPKRVVIGL